jgi:hypothetical protein
MPPTLTRITPDAGATTGGTAVTITGSNFASGALVTIGGVAATDVVVRDSSTLSAKTGSHAVGAASVVVSVNGLTATLTDAFTYANPGPENNPPPKITALTAQGSRPNEPEQFADLGESITVTATVTDADTPVSQLAFEWTADQGTLTGSGPSVTWKAPEAGDTPLKATIHLTITERYITPDSVIHENKVEQSTTVSVHDSVKEVGDMATLFLENFSRSEVPTSVVMKDFLVGCYGTASERSDVQDNRETYIITSWAVHAPSVTVNFGGTCPLSRRGDACAQNEVRWDSTKKSNGHTGSTSGVDYVAAMYRGSRWWLCDSQFRATSTVGAAMVIGGAR